MYTRNRDAPLSLYSGPLTSTLLIINLAVACKGSRRACLVSKTVISCKQTQHCQREREREGGREANGACHESAMPIPLLSSAYVGIEKGTKDIPEGVRLGFYIFGLRQDPIILDAVIQKMVRPPRV
jgi:hypothetical protein